MSNVAIKFSHTGPSQGALPLADRGRRIYILSRHRFGVTLALISCQSLPFFAFRKAASLESSAHCRRLACGSRCRAAARPRNGNLWERYPLSGEPLTVPTTGNFLVVSFPCFSYTPKNLRETERRNRLAFAFLGKLRYTPDGTRPAWKWLNGWVLDNMFMRLLSSSEGLHGKVDMTFFGLTGILRP